MNTFGNRLKTLRKEKGYTQQDLSDILKITKSTVSMYENDNREPEFEKLEEIADLFNVNLDYLLGRSNQRNVFDYTSKLEKKDILTPKEKEHIKKYRALKDNGIKQIIDDLLELEYKRIQEQDNADNAIYDDNGNRITSFQGYLNFKYQSSQALYIDKVSAGLGFFPIDDDYQPIGSPFTNADYAFQVDGDSMLPKYHNGDMIYVKKQSALYDGEIGVVVYNGKGYLKKYYKEDTDIYLVSLNEDYEDISITLDEDTNFYIVGKVIGHVLLKEFM